MVCKSSESDRGGYRHPERTIKLLQVEPKDGQHRFVAAACETIPEEIRSRNADRDHYVAEAIRKMLWARDFEGSRS